MNQLINFSLSGDLILQQTINDLVSTNEKTGEYGLLLTQKNAKELIQTRNSSLKGFDRVEVGTGVIEKIINAFYDSGYLLQSNYAETLHELIEIFYYMKNETLDLIGDDELIETMKDFFEKRCGGSLELLQGRELEIFARNIRFGKKEYRIIDEKADLLLEEEEDES